MHNQDILVEKPWFVWFVMFLFWTVFSTVLTIQDLLVWDAKPDKFSGWWEVLLNSYPFFYTWFALSPFIFWFGRKFGFGSEEKNIRNFIIHIFLCLLIVFVYLAFTSIIVVPLAYEKYDVSKMYLEFNRRVYMVGHFQVIVYWAILGVYVSFDYYKKFRERENEASRLLLRSTTLETQLAKAQLDSLKMQLHPHFLFNTLHAISALMDDSPKRARRMIARLGELLRSTLDIAEQQTVTLEKEITLTKLYLEIEQERFGEMLQVKIDIPKNELDCVVPSLILQPLIENVIKHGITNDEEPTIIEIKVIRANNKIQISVEDNGPGFSEVDALKLQDGIGLSNTKARLEQIYGEDHNFTLQNSEEGGAIVEILIPCNKKINPK